MALKKVEIYTDGACSGNPGVGGWGALLLFKDKEKRISGKVENTTNNRMELVATIEALKALNEKCEVIIHTDSQYVRKGITEWVKSWQNNNWKNSSKKPVKNVDLWKELLAIEGKQHVEWRWVKGHSGIEGNEIADYLATGAISG